MALPSPLASLPTAVASPGTLVKDLEQAMQREAELLTRNAAASAASLLATSDYTRLDEITKHLAGHESVEAESVRVRFLRFGPFSLDIELFAYVFASSWERFLAIQEELLLDVMTIVERAGATIAMPSQTVYFADAGHAGSAAPAGSTLPAAFNRHDVVT